MNEIKQNEQTFLIIAGGQETAVFYMPCHSCDFDFDITENACTAGQGSSAMSRRPAMSSHGAGGRPVRRRGKPLAARRSLGQDRHSPSLQLADGQL